MSIVYVGRPQNIPDGWKETANGMHLGGGVWAIQIERTGDDEHEPVEDRTSEPSGAEHGSSPATGTTQSTGDGDMGECGCESEKLGRIRGPGDWWYVVELYPGCPSCGPDWAVGLSRVREDDYVWTFYEDAPVIEFNDWGEWWVGVMNGDQLLRRFAEDMDLGEYEPDGALHDFVRGGGLREAAFDAIYRSNPPATET